MTSPPVKKWIARLAGELNRHNGEIPNAAVFLTHAMPDKAVEGRVKRLQRSLSQVQGIGEVYPEWLSGQVKAIPGPFVDGTFEAAATFAAGLFERVQAKS